LVLQSSLFDSLAFDLLPHSQTVLTASEVDISRRGAVERFFDIADDCSDRRDSDRCKASQLSRDSPVDQRIDVSLLVQRFHGRVDFVVEGFGVGERLMDQMMLHEIVPDNFDVVEFGGILGSNSTVSQCWRAASAARVILLTWIGPLSSTSTTGFIVCPGLGP
jgi:hypothetical protein